MKKSKLKNRFNKDELKAVWAFHFTCLWCGQTGFDCFHHIKSPSSRDYKKGDFNSSILNALPIHNFGCHIGNSELHKLENEAMLIRKVLFTLLKIGYELKEIDKEFLCVYAIDVSGDRT